MNNPAVLIIIRIIILMLIPILSIAAHQGSPAPVTGLGQVARNLMEPVGLFADFVHSACIIIGAAFLFAAFIKYIEHRRSPLMVPISTVIFLLIAGIVLILLPFLSYLNENAVQYSLLKQTAWLKKY